MVNNMAFENINVSYLREALTQCKDSINHESTDQLIYDVSDTSIWQTDAQVNLIKALTKLTTERYKELEDKINSYFIIVEKIEKYQELQIENRELNQQFSYLNLKVQSADSDDSRSLYNTQLHELQMKINDNELTMQNLEKMVSNLI